MELTLELIKNQSTAQSFERGEYYFQSKAIQHLIKHGDIYEAEVRGTQNYKQTFDLRGRQVNAICTCPYDYAGLCKHLVAVGMAIIHEQFTQIQPTIGNSNHAEIIPIERFWEDLFIQTNEKTRNRFLKQLFEKHDRLRESFIKYTENQIPEIYLVDISSLAEEFFTELKAVDLSHKGLTDFFSRQAQHAVPEFVEDAVEIILKKIFKPYVQQMAKYLKREDFLNAMHVLLGMYEAYCKTGEPHNNEFLSEGEFSHHIWVEVYDSMQLFLFGIRQAIISTAQAKQLLETIFRRWSYHEQRYDGVNPHAIRYELESFEDLLIACCPDEVVAHYLKTRLEAYSMSLPYLNNYIRSKLAAK